jgi:protein tyrosine/serine phosphatase
MNNVMHQTTLNRKPVIKNFHQLDPWLFRGGQPSPAGLQHLKQIGVRTVVCLRWTASVIAEERHLVREFGMDFENFRLNYWDLPSDEVVERFFNLMEDRDKHPIFLHCQHGKDRTGLLIAYYRIARQGWSATRAYAEMKEYGFHRLWMRHFKWAVFNFERRIQQSQR